jgi:hypothetical protein
MELGTAPAKPARWHIKRTENDGSVACDATSAGSLPKGYTWWVGNCRWTSSRSPRRLLLVDCWRRKLPLNANAPSASGNTVWLLSCFVDGLGISEETVHDDVDVEWNGVEHPAIATVMSLELPDFDMLKSCFPTVGNQKKSPSGKIRLKFGWVVAGRGGGTGWCITNTYTKSRGFPGAGLITPYSFWRLHMDYKICQISILY